MPTLVANYIPPGMDVILQSENGRAGRGSVSRAGQGRRRSDQRGEGDHHRPPGAAFFSSADSFAMVRGGHVDLTILGAMEVDRKAISRTG